MAVNTPSETTVAASPNPLPCERPDVSQTADTAPVPAATWSLLALLRFVLASIVVFAHIDTGFSAGSANPVVSWMWSFGGNQAVICFFVISGFSIGASVERRHEHFYERRFWRIYPVYLTCFALACVPFAIFGPAIASRNGMGDTELPLGRWWAASFLLNAIALPNIITPALATFSQA